MSERTSRRKFLIGLTAVGAGKLLLDSKPAQAQITRPERTPKVEQTQSVEFRWTAPIFPREFLEERYQNTPETQLKRIAGQEVYKIDPKISSTINLIRQLGDLDMNATIERFITENKQYRLSPEGQQPVKYSVLEIRSSVFKPLDNESFGYYYFEPLEKDGEKRLVHSLVIDARNIDKERNLTNGLRYLLGFYQTLKVMHINEDYINSRLAEGATIEQLADEAQDFALVKRAISIAEPITVEIYKRNNGFHDKPGIIDNIIIADFNTENQSIASAPEEATSLPKETE